MHVNGWLDVGGIEEILLITAKHNLKQKYDLAFISYRSEYGYTARQLRKLGYPVYGLNLSSALHDLRIIPKLVKIFRSYKPHIVSFYQKSSFLGRIAARIAGVGVIICNEVDLNYQQKGLGRILSAYLRKALIPITDKVIVCSQAVLDYWAKGDDKKYIVIYPPFDSTKFPSNMIRSEKNNYKNGKYPVIGTVSRISQEKGHKYLIQGMRIINKSFPSARLKIVGTGPLINELQALSESMGLGKIIQFIGFADDLYHELASMDVFVLPSLTEGFPISLQEAMAARLPVAASAVGGIPELVENGKSGLLFPPKNPEETARSVIEILTNRKKAEEMGRYGQELVTVNYTPRIYIDKLGKLYDELLIEKGIEP
jgi:glycosyltransferase involved in cell wall biosynthesis